MQTPSPVPSTRTAALTLVTLDSLPCGCVTGVFQARLAMIEVELVEAKGPNCVFFEHEPGRVTRLGVPDEFDAQGSEVRV